MTNTFFLGDHWDCLALMRSKSWFEEISRWKMFPATSGILRLNLNRYITDHPTKKNSIIYNAKQRNKLFCRRKRTFSFVAFLLCSCDFSPPLGDFNFISFPDNLNSFCFGVEQLSAPT